MEKATDLEIATVGYGLGNWHFYNGDRARAEEYFRRIVAGKYWPAFGFIASEAELARLAAASKTSAIQTIRKQQVNELHPDRCEEKQVHDSCDQLNSDHHDQEETQAPSLYVRLQRRARSRVESGQDKSSTDYHRDHRMEKAKAEQDT